jgi:hypothetical protein
MPRIEPLTPPYPAPIDQALRRWMPPGVTHEPLTLFRVLHRNPELASRMFALGAGLLGHGLLPAIDREIIIARVTARTGCAYEWGGTRRDPRPAGRTEPVTAPGHHRHRRRSQHRVAASSCGTAQRRRRTARHSATLTTRLGFPGRPLRRRPTPGVPRAGRLVPNHQLPGQRTPPGGRALGRPVPGAVSPFQLHAELARCRARTAWAGHRSRLHPDRDAW